MSVETAVASDLPIALASGDSNAVTVPESVTIPAGATSATFVIGAVDDNQANGDRTVNLYANPAAYPGAVTAIAVTVLDVPPTMTLKIAPDTFPESAGPQAAKGTLTLSKTLASALAIRLSSSETFVGVPESVTIAAGETSAQFDVAAVDDDEPHAQDRAATVTATAQGLQDATASVTVQDLYLEPQIGYIVAVNKKDAKSKVCRRGPVRASFQAAGTASGTRWYWNFSTLTDSLTVASGGDGRPKVTVKANDDLDQTGGASGTVFVSGKRKGELPPVVSDPATLCLVDANLEAAQNGDWASEDAQVVAEDGELGTGAYLFRPRPDPADLKRRDDPRLPMRYRVGVGAPKAEGTVTITCEPGGIVEFCTGPRGTDIVTFW